MNEGFGGEKRFHLPRRRVLIPVVAVVLAGAVAGTVLIVRRNSGSQASATYREYSVSKGDVTVGTTESGTAALENDTISFPVECTISSVPVKSGQKVKKGDALVQLDMSSVSDSTSDTRQKLEAAKVSLQSALNDQKSKLQAAKITYESSKYLAASAPVTKQLTLGDLQNSVASAQTALANDQKALSQYQALQKTWAADYAKLQQLKQWTDDAKAAQTSYNNQLTAFNTTNAAVISTYNNLKSAADSAGQKYVALKYSDSPDAVELAEAETAYRNAADTLSSYNTNVANTVISQQSTLEDQVAQAEAEYNNYNTAYTSFQQTYSDKYKVTGTDLDDKAASLQQSVKTDQYNLDKAKKTAQISSAEAGTKEENDLNTANSAQDAYDLTVSQLSQAATAAQESYDKLQNQMNEIDNALNGNGVIVSPADGFVASVAYKAGSSVAAGQAIMTISTDNSVSLSLSVSEDDIANVSVGQEASISLTAYDSQTFDALVESITAEPARSGSSSVSYTVVVKSTGRLGDIGTVYDGMSGEATIIQKRVRDALYVNNKAITFSNGVSSVLVRDQSGNTAAKTVGTGFSNGTNVEITGGLSEGDTVLAESAVSSK